MNPNTVYQVDGGPPHRLLWCSTDGRRGVSIAVAGSHWPVPTDLTKLEADLCSGRAVEVPDTVIQQLVPDEALTPAQRAAMEAAWELIAALVKNPQIFNPDRRAALLTEVAQAKQVHVATVRKHLRRYWQRGQIKTALQPDFRRCGGPGQARIGVAHPGSLTLTEQDHAAMKATLKKNYHNERRFPLTKAYEALLAEHYAAGHKVTPQGVEVPQLKPPAERPSVHQFRHYLERHYRKDQSNLARMGEVNFGRTYRGLLGVQTHMATGPGALYQIDATTADVDLVHSGQPKRRIGRPIVYLVVDTYTGLVAGLHVTLGSASYNAAGMALWNAYSDKVEFCRGLGITLQPEQWPACGLPEALLADRGEMLGQLTHAMVEELNITLTNTAPYRADAKGLVERHFRLLNDAAIHWLPGAQPDKHAVGTRRNAARLEACLTREEFMAALVHAILAHNKEIRPQAHLHAELIRDEVEPRPHKIWAWAGPRLRTLDPKWVRVCLMPATTGRVTERGIRINGALYTCERERAGEWRALARNKGWNVKCVYDPYLVDCVYLVGATIGDIEPCQLDQTDRRFTGWAVAELNDYHEHERKALKAGKLDDYQTRVTSQAEMRAVVQGAEARKGTQGDAHLADVMEDRVDQLVRDGQLAAQQTMKLAGNPAPPAPPPTYQLGDKYASQWESNDPS